MQSKGFPIRPRKRDDTCELPQTCILVAGRLWLSASVEGRSTKQPEEILVLLVRVRYRGKNAIVSFGQKRSIEIAILFA